jgi:Na+/phosphate symporter
MTDERTETALQSALERQNQLTRRLIAQQEQIKQLEEELTRRKVAETGGKTRIGLFVREN